MIVKTQSIACAFCFICWKNPSRFLHGFICQQPKKYFCLPLVIMMTDSANAFWDKWTSGYKEALSMPLVIHIAARTQREFEYEEKIVFEVIKETGGERIAPELGQWWTDHMDFFMIVCRQQAHRV